MSDKDTSGQPHADAEDDPVRDLLKTCDRAPLEGLAWIDQMGDDLRSSPMIMFARFIALRHLALDSFAGAGVTELGGAREADVLRIMDEESRINASAALAEAAAIEARHPGYLESLGDQGDRFALRMLDDVCIVNERLQPGRVQQALGWTKLQYFGGERIKVLAGQQDAPDDGLVGVCIRTKMRPAEIARSAVLYSTSIDPKHRHYVDAFLTERDVRTTPTIGDANMFCAVRLYEDGEVEFSKAVSDDTPAVSTPPECGRDSSPSPFHEIPPTKGAERIAEPSETNAGRRWAWFAVAVGVLVGIGALGWFLRGSPDEDSRSHRASLRSPLAERTAVSQEAPRSANTASGADARVETNPHTGILKQMARDGAITQECVDEGLDDKEILTIRRIDLNRDGSPEFEVSGSPGCACIGARRCAKWIYQAISGGYRQIIEEVQPEEGIEVLDSETNGYADLAIIGLSGDEALRELLRFDGRTYQSSGMKPLSASRLPESTASSVDIGENRADTSFGEPDSNPELATVNTPGDGFLALRSEPSVSTGTRRLKIPHGTELALDRCLAVSPNDRWCQTTFRGETGWVSERYLSRGPSERSGAFVLKESSRAQSGAESDHRSSSAISAPFAASPPFRWLQIASRATEAEAVELARHYEERNPDLIRLFKANNGWYAITGGLVDVGDKEHLARIVKSKGYPADSLLVGGGTYIERVPF